MYCMKPMTKKIKEDLEDFVLPTDSLEVMEAVMEFEDEYDIVITANQIATLKSKDDLIALLDKKVLDK